jgi:hypothetical protein
MVIPTEVEESRSLDKLEMILLFLREEIALGDDGLAKARFESSAGVARDLAASHGVGFDFGGTRGIFRSVDLGGRPFTEHSEY